MKIMTTATTVRKGKNTYHDNLLGCSNLLIIPIVIESGISVATFSKLKEELKETKILLKEQQDEVETLAIRVEELEKKMRKRQRDLVIDDDTHMLLKRHIREIIHDENHLLQRQPAYSQEFVPSSRHVRTHQTSISFQPVHAYTYLRRDNAIPYAPYNPPRCDYAPTVYYD